MNGSFSVQANKKVLRLFLKLVLKHYKTDKLMRGLLYFPCSLSKSQFNFHFLIHYKLLVAKICCKFLPSTFYDLCALDVRYLFKKHVKTYILDILQLLIF